MLAQLQSILLQNPNRTASVPPIEIRPITDTQDGDSVPSTLCGFVPTLLEPPGPVALVLWKTDPEFRAATIPVRRTILRETILKLHERIDRELKGHRWSRKKIQEQLAAQQSADVSPPQNTRELDEALAYLYQVQLVVVDEANKKVHWVPEDPRTWSPERPVWGVALGARAVLHNTNETPVANRLSAWVSDREQDKWKIHWPVADGTLESMKAAMATLGTSIGGLRLEKPKKADYATALGRAQAIRHLETHFAGAAAAHAEALLA